MSGLKEFRELLEMLSNLTPTQKQAVREMLGQVPSVDVPARNSEAIDTPTRIVRHFQPFSDSDRNAIRDYAELYIRSTTRQRQKIYREAAKTLGRTPESVKKAIRIARRQIEQEQAK